MDSTRDQLRQNGFAVARNLVSLTRIESLRSALRDLMRLKTGSQARDLDELYFDLTNLGPAAVMDIIRVSRDLPEYYDLCLDPNVVCEVRRLLGSQIVQMVHDICLFRIDPRDDDSRSFQWHQDYPYNCMSLNAVTAWIPLMPVNPEMGGVRVLPGSHSEIRDVRSSATSNSDDAAKGHKSFEVAITVSDELERQSSEISDFEPGDVLFLHPLTIHKSGLNRSARARWVCNPRFGDAEDPKLIARGWQTARDKNPYYFAHLHRDKVQPQ